MKPSEVISNAIELFGPNGEHWIQGALENTETGSYCMLGALLTAASGNKHHSVQNIVNFNKSQSEDLYAFQHASQIVAKCVSSSGHVCEIPRFNDTGGRPFSDVKHAMCKAVKTALAEEEAADGNPTS